MPAKKQLTQSKLMKLIPEAKTRLTEFLSDHLKPDSKMVLNYADPYEADLNRPESPYTETLEIPARLTVSGHVESIRFTAEDFETGEID